MTTLRTECLLLRPVVVSDVTVLIWTDREVRRHLWDDGTSER